MTKVRLGENVLAPNQGKLISMHMTSRQRSCNQRVRCLLGVALFALVVFGQKWRHCSPYLSVVVGPNATVVWMDGQHTRGN